MIQTDLPEPVEPATRRWGILVKSNTLGVPIISLPKAAHIEASLFKFWGDSKTSLRVTLLIVGLGISTPIVLLPGIGAWIITSLAAKARAISLLILTIRLTLVPAGTVNSYSVTAGPMCISTTLAFIPKSLKTRSKISLLLLVKSVELIFFCFIGSKIWLNLGSI